MLYKYVNFIEAHSLLGHFPDSAYEQRLLESDSE